MKLFMRMVQRIRRSKRAFDVRSRTLDLAHAEVMVDHLEGRLFDTLEALSAARSICEAEREKLLRAEARLAEATFVPAAPVLPVRAAMPGISRRRIGQGDFWLRAGAKA